MTFLKIRFQKQLVHSNVICLKHAENRREDESKMKSATYVDYDNLDENEEEEEEPNKEEIDAKRKIFEKEAKKEIQQEFVDKIGIHIDYIKQGKWTSTNGNSAS